MKKIITTEWLVDVLRAVSAKNQYTNLIKIPQNEEVAFVTDLMHAAIQQTFVSVERISDYDYEVLFSKYVDKAELFNAARVEFHLEEEISQIPYYCEIAQTTLHREVKSLPSLYDMCAVVYDSVYHDFVEALYAFLDIDRINRYSKVQLLSVDSGSESFLLKTEGDIRTDIFKELFPNGSFVESKFNEIKAFLESSEEAEDD